MESRKESSMNTLLLYLLSQRMPQEFTGSSTMVVLYRMPTVPHM